MPRADTWHLVLLVIKNTTCLLHSSFEAVSDKIQKKHKENIAHIFVGEVQGNKYNIWSQFGSSVRWSKINMWREGLSVGYNTHQIRIQILSGLCSLHYRYMLTFYWLSWQSVWKMKWLKMDYITAIWQPFKRNIKWTTVTNTMWQKTAQHLHTERRSKRSGFYLSMCVADPLQTKKLKPGVRKFFMSLKQLVGFSADSEWLLEWGGVDDARQ